VRHQTGHDQREPTDIDLTADIETHSTKDHVTARIPLAGPVTGEWRACYERLARAACVPVQAKSDAGRAWIVVTVAAGGSHAEIAKTLNAALTLIAESDTALARTSPAEQAEASVRDWWGQRQAGAARRRPSRKAEVVRTGIGAEKRWLLATALAVAMAILLLLPARFSLGPNWTLPAVEALLLTVILAADRSRYAARFAVIWGLSIVMVLILAAGAVFITGRLVTDLVEGGPETNSAAELLGIGFGVWIYTIIAFAFLYWLLDGGGPEARIWHPPAFPDLAFPEQLNPGIAPPGWRPDFADYLYLGFTNATAFSPTDVMPLARWGKLAMTVQATGSLAVLGLVVARAVNIFK
jgi:hypothetical protein